MNQIKLLFISSGILLASVLGIVQEPKDSSNTQNNNTSVEDNQMQFGNFSVSLTVKDINASKDFYEKLDFKPVGGDLKQNWLVMQNGPTTIGLFQGMFEKNILTFNPGWNKDKETLKDFEDVRSLQKKLKQRGIEFATEADEDSTGPASFVLVDPDGNPVMVDQHVPKPQ